MKKVPFMLMQSMLISFNFAVLGDTYLISKTLDRDIINSLLLSSGISLLVWYALSRFSNKETNIIYMCPSFFAMNMFAFMNLMNVEIDPEYPFPHIFIKLIYSFVIMVCIWFCAKSVVKEMGFSFKRTFWFIFLKTFLLCGSLYLIINEKVMEGFICAGTVLFFSSIFWTLRTFAYYKEECP